MPEYCTFCRRPDTECRHVAGRKTCLDCRRDKDRYYYAANRDHIREGMKAWRARNLKRDAEYKHRYSLRSLYGVTQAQYRVLLNSQGGVCAICRKPPCCRRLDVDHDHKTGKVRGLLCNACNKALGLLKDDHGRITRMASYISQGFVCELSASGAK